MSFSQLIGAFLGQQYSIPAIDNKKFFLPMKYALGLLEKCGFILMWFLCMLHMQFLTCGHTFWWCRFCLLTGTTLFAMQLCYGHQCWALKWWCALLSALLSRRYGMADISKTCLRSYKTVLWAFLPKKILYLVLL